MSNMGNTSDEILVGANGTIWVGPTTSVAPDDVSTGMETVDSDWMETGFVDENGVKWTDGKTVVPIPVWQSFYAARRIVSDRASMVVFALRQWSGVTVPLAFGGGTVTDNAGEFTYTPPSPEELDERSLCVEWEDGSKKYRLYFPRGMVTSTTETVLQRQNAANLPITFEGLSDGTADIWSLFTDDPAFAVVS